MTINTRPTAHDVREAERKARNTAIGLRHGAPPPGIDRFAHRHATRLASLWMEIATVHAEYAAELEGRAS